MKATTLINSLEDHHLKYLTNEFIFQRVTSNGKGSGIYHSQKVCGSFKIGVCMRIWANGTI